MGGNQIKILAIDDQQDYLTALKDVMARALSGAEIFTATSGQKGIALALEKVPDVILLDIAMPGMSGFEVCRRLKADVRLKDTPVVFLTAVKPGGENGREILEAGGEGFLRKPFEAEELVVQIRAVAKSRADKTARARERDRLETLVAAGTRELAKGLAGRKEIEAELRESEARYRTLYESSRDALMTLFPPDWKFLSGNPAAVEMFGAKDEADFTSRRLWEVSPECQPDGELSSAGAERMIGTAMEKGVHFFEWTHKKIGGRDFPATVLLTRIELGGKTGLQATVRDISAQKRAEGEREKLREQFLQSQKMEAIGHMAGGIAHDFNNILTAIMGYAGFLRAALPAGDPKHSDVREILKAGERAAALTGQLLTFSRKQAVQFKVLDLDRLVPETVTMLSRMLPENIGVKTFLNSAPAAVLANQGQLEQVLLNLAVNARDAMPDGGELLFETAQTELDENYAAVHAGVSPGRCVRLAVSDTGRGMGPEVLTRIFEPFFTTKERGKGTGLGLSTVYGIVRQSGGSIFVYSEPGKGTAFKIYLPIAGVAGGVKPAEKPAVSSFSGTGTILLVEDDEAVRRFIFRTLSQNGYSVLEAASPRDAIKLCELRRDIDLMLTDMVMPQMNGRDLAGAAAALVPRMGVVYMSGYTSNALTRQNILEPGAVFLEKPLKAETVLRRVREALEAGRR